MNAEQAKAEAIRQRTLQNRLNFFDDDYLPEYAYSPATGAVGMRNWPGDVFRVFNVKYPMYRRHEPGTPWESGVMDWMSVGSPLPKEARP